MRKQKRIAKVWAAVLAIAGLLTSLPGMALAQDAPPPPPPQDQAPPPTFAPDQLDKMVSRIALYPDPLLAQILAAATYPNDIPDAAKWADEHHYLRGQELANAIQGDQLPWDPSVQALLPFPSVLDMMASDMNWTSDIGNAFLAQRQDVMDAVQRERHKAYQYGYLRSNDQVAVTDGPYIGITPVNPDFVVVPVYDPGIVFFAPRPGFFIGGGIRFGFGISLGVWFHPWGWGATRFDWGGHGVFIAGRPWGRVWGNRFTYVHAGWGPGVQRWQASRRAETHALVRRDEHERAAAREGHAREQEHHRPEGHPHH
jgi:Protein of unknown function (DUF3300)